MKNTINYIDFVTCITKNNQSKLFSTPITSQMDMREFFTLDLVVIDRQVIDIHSVTDWEFMLKNGIIEQSYNGHKGRLMTQLGLTDNAIQISYEILDLIYQYGRKEGLYKNLDKCLNIIHNISVLNFLLSKGARFKTHKYSTMEGWFYAVDCNLFKEFVTLLMKYPKAVDIKFIKKNQSRVLLYAQMLYKYQYKEQAEFLFNLLRVATVKSENVWRFGL